MTDGDILGSGIYVKGLTSTDEKHIRVFIVAHENNVTLWRGDDTPLVSIPYPNLRQARSGYADLPLGGQLLGKLTGGREWYKGLELDFIDPDIQRELMIFIGWRGSSGHRKARRLADAIYRRRDEYVLRMSK